MDFDNELPIEKKRYTYKDDFEMLILRHEYLEKVENPDPTWIAEFEPIVKQTARIMYDKLKPNFEKVGYGLDDIIAVTNVYMISYMSIYSLRNNKEANQKAVDKHKLKNNEIPDEIEMKRKDRNNLISFLRQRLYNTSAVCGRKARNITVGKDIKVAFAFTNESVAASSEAILENPRKMGYRKVTKPELKEAKKLSRDASKKELYDVQGFKIIEINLPNKGIKAQDYRCLFSENNEDIYHLNPEESFSLFEDRMSLYENSEDFEKMNHNEKKHRLRDFVTVNKEKPRYKEEIKTARKMLRDLKAVVL